MSESIPDFDLYGTLGVGRRDPPGVIVAAYKALIRGSHPDLSSDPGSVETSKRLNIARDWLLDPERRARYDAAHPRSDDAAARGADRPGSRRGRRHVRGRSLASAEVWVFVARCGTLSRIDLWRLLVLDSREEQSRRDAAAEGAHRAARIHDLEGLTHTATISAIAAVPHQLRSSRLDGVVRRTMLGLVVEDVAPDEAFVLLRPWREAISRSDARARARRVVVSRARRQIRKAMSVVLALILIALSVAGFIVGVSLLTTGAFP